MNKSVLQLKYSTKINDIVEANESFDKATMLVGYTGLNRNNSFISKESFEKAIPSMYNCPIVTKYDRDPTGKTWGELGEHNIEYIQTPEGNQMVATTQPVGVVPESAGYSWVNIDDGNEIHEYLAVDVLLWKRQEAYQKIKKDGIVEQSMEISIFDGEFVNGYYQINDFEFTAFCLLGSDVIPCFESASLFTNKQQDIFKVEFSKMMIELKEYYSNNISDKKKEVKINMNIFNKLLEKYNVTIDDIEFEYQDLSDEELEEKFKEHFSLNSEVEFDEQEPEKNSTEEFKEDDNKEIEPQNQPEESDKTNYALISNIRNQLRQIISNREVIKQSYDDGCEYSIPKYNFEDFDDNTKEVFYSSCNNDFSSCTFYGTFYRLDGDNVVIDFEKEKKKKLVFVDYIDGEQLVNYNININTIHDSLTDIINKQSVELETLKNYKKSVDDNAKEKLLNDFEEQLSNNKDFELLKENKNAYSVEALEKELFVLYGKSQMNNFKCSKTNKSGIRMSNDYSDNVENNLNDPYGDIFSKYGYKMKEVK